MFYCIPQVINGFNGQWKVGYVQTLFEDSFDHTYWKINKEIRITNQYTGIQ